MLTHLPSHAGKVTKGCIVERGSKITCKSCRRQIEEARRVLPDYIKAVHDDLKGNLPPAYANRSIEIEAWHAGTMARQAFHYAGLVTFEEGTR